MSNSCWRISRKNSDCCRRTSTRRATPQASMRSAWRTRVKERDSKARARMEPKGSKDKKKILCPFLQKGCCSFGDRCYYKHPDASHQPPPTNPKTDAQRKIIPCRNHKKGTCKMGTSADIFMRMQLQPKQQQKPWNPDGSGEGSSSKSQSISRSSQGLVGGVGECVQDGSLRSSRG